MKAGDLKIEMRCLDGEGQEYGVGFLIKNAMAMTGVELETELGRINPILVANFRRTLAGLGIKNALGAVALALVFAANGFGADPRLEAGFVAPNDWGHDAVGHDGKVASSRFVGRPDGNGVGAGAVAPIRVARIEGDEAEKSHRANLPANQAEVQP